MSEMLIYSYFGFLYSNLLVYHNTEYHFNLLMLNMSFCVGGSKGNVGIQQMYPGKVTHIFDG